MREFIAVYGTLRRGYGNHRLLGDSPFLGRFKTVEQFTMRASGFPIIERTADHPANITVELYMVRDPEVLAALDALEGHPDWYRRQKVELDNGTEAWIYVMPGGECGTWDIVPSGDYSDYRKPRTEVA